MTKSFDVIVVGGGTAGLRGSLAFAHAGLNTLLIEPGVLGGTCLNYGCIPSKALLHAAHSYQEAIHMSHFGIETHPKIHFRKMMNRVNGIVMEGQKHIKKGIKTLTIIKKPGHFTSRNTIRVDNHTFRGEKIIISTGAINVVPSIPGLSEVDYVTNENILSLKELPKSVICIGGGYISMEYATFFAGLGCEVSVLERFPLILGMLDDDIRAELLNCYKRKLKILTNVNINSVKQLKTKKRVIYQSSHRKNSVKKTLHADLIVVATGRKPATDGLHLALAGIKRGERGEILVDNRLRTSNPRVYAVGDVNGKSMFAHSAKREINIVTDNIIHKHKRIMHFDLVPWAVFTSPVVSGVGLSEKEASKKYKVGILKASFRSVGRAAIIEETEGFAKIIYNKKNNRILGALIIGPRADDLIHEFAILLHTKNPTISVLRNTIHAHPTLSEVMENLKEV